MAILEDKVVPQFLTKINMFLPGETANMVFGIYPSEVKTYVYTKTSTWTFITASFIDIRNVSLRWQILLIQEAMYREAQSYRISLYLKLNFAVVLNLSNI